MKYEQVEDKMPPDVKRMIKEESWWAAWIQEEDDLAPFLTQRPLLAELNKQLTTDEQRTLRLIVSAFGCLPFTGEALEKQAAWAACGAQTRLGLIGLRRLGVIVTFRKSWGEQLFLLPEDTFAIWQELLFPVVKFPGGREEAPGEELEWHELVQDESQRAVAANPRGLAQMMLHVLTACAQQPAMPLSAKGTLHKKQVHKLSEPLRLPPAILTAAGLSYAFRDVYDEPVALLLDLATRSGFFKISGLNEALRLHKPSVEAWLQGDYKWQQETLYALWCDMMTPAPAWLQHAIACMERARSGAWYKVEQLLMQVRACLSFAGGHAEAELLEDELCTAWLQPLMAFRFIDVSKDTEGQLWFRWLIEPRKTLNPDEPAVVESQERPGSMYVQPDFELLLPPDVGLYTEWEVASFADLLQSDYVRSYRMTKNSFRRALASGKTAEQIAETLAAHASHEVPQGVLRTLVEWAEQANKVALEDVTLLRCASEADAEALLRSSRCAPYLADRVGPAAFIIAKADAGPLAKCLEAMGYAPHFKGAKRAESPEAGAEHLLAADFPVQPLCYSRDSARIYEMEPSLPRQEDLYPDLQDIPPSWIKEFRNYHASTRKDMIRKAIEWKSVLQLRKEGQDRFIIPRMLREEKTVWHLEGLEQDREISVPGEDWQEMKLILPGINDAFQREKEETLENL
ncbi:helicase-associated domain-containing protein [Paenibacillus ferrarius]|uniref:helicase-associated domain-containing protein n=1 Tax=Paenibacillus ferrarius TaxID=1469647 RepID=UPI003D2A0611